MDERYKPFIDRCSHAMKHDDFFDGQYVERLSYRIGKPNLRITFVPGLPGDTVGQINDFILNPQHQKNFFQDIDVQVLLHSGVITEGNDSLVAGFPRMREIIAGSRKAHGQNAKIDNVGVLPDDWIEDIKISLRHDDTYKSQLPTKIIGHSFGGVFSLVALGELIDKELLKTETKDGKPRVTLILISSPTYKKESLPDRRALTGSSPDSDFTYYWNWESTEKMGINDNRIPMASLYAFDNIWDFLRNSNTIRVNQNRELFNRQLQSILFERLIQATTVLRNTSVKVISLTPHLDRWISQADKDLKEMLGESLIAEKFDIPSAFYQSNTEVNVHELIGECLPIIFKF